MEIETVLNELKNEYLRGQEIYGDLDNRNTISDYNTYVMKYLSVAHQEGAGIPGDPYSVDGVRSAYLKAAGLCLAAVIEQEKQGRLPERHFE